MSNKSLKQHAVEYYHTQTMNQHKLDQLLELSESINSRSKLSRNKIPDWRSIAAVLVIASSITLGINQYQKNTLIKIVPQEIALNHSKQLSLEFYADNYASLDKMMNKLDFNLLASSNTSLAGLTILGARYCSIQGNLAAQIRLKDKKGTYYTLYQTPITSALKTEKTGTFLSGDIKITQWQENNLFFGLAKSD